MTTLTATPLPEGAVRLAITAAPAGPVRILRVDRNGTNPVRVPAAVDMTVGGTLPVLTDWEVALAGAVRYLVLDAQEGQTFATATVAPSEALPQLRRVYRPAIGGPVAAGIVDVTGGQELARSEHRVVARPDTVFTTYRLGLRSGTITYRAQGRVQADAIRDVYADGQVCLLRAPDHDGLDVFHLGLNVSPAVEEVEDDTWLQVVTFAEVLPAAGDTLAPWTLADVAQVYETLAAVGLSYATLDDLAANDPLSGS